MTKLAALLLFAGILSGQITRVPGASGSGCASFNPSLTSLQTALNASATTPVNIVLFGDSITRCSMTTSGACNVGPQRYGSLWGQMLQQYLQSSYGNHGTGIVPLVIGSGAVDLRWWTLGGTTAISNVIGPTQPGVGNILQMANGATATLVRVHGDSVTIYYATGSDTGAGFSVSVDGANKGTLVMLQVPITRQLRSLSQ